MNKTFVLLVYFRMYPYVSRMYPYVSGMYPYVSRMLLVCYSYVIRMYSCGVLVMIVSTRVIIQKCAISVIFENVHVVSKT